MKKLIILLTISTLSTSAMAEETSGLDSLKNLVGLSEAKEQSVKAPSSNGLASLLNVNTG